MVLDEQREVGAGEWPGLCAILFVAVLLSIVGTVAAFYQLEQIEDRVVLLDRIKAKSHQVLVEGAVGSVAQHPAAWKSLYDNFSMVSMRFPELAGEANRFADKLSGKSIARLHSGVPFASMPDAALVDAVDEWVDNSSRRLAKESVSVFWGSLLAIVPAAIVSLFAAINGAKNRMVVLPTSPAVEGIDNVRQSSDRMKAMEDIMWDSKFSAFVDLSENFTSIRQSGTVVAADSEMGAQSSPLVITEQEALVAQLHQMHDRWQGMVPIIIGGITRQFHCVIARKSEHRGFLLNIYDTESEMETKLTRQEILRGIAHDLRAALTSIVLGIESVFEQETAVPSEEISRFADLKMRIRCTTQLLENYLSLEKLKALPSAFVKELVEVAGILDAALDEAEEKLCVTIPAEINCTKEVFINGNLYKLIDSIAQLLFWSASVAQEDTLTVTASVRSGLVSIAIRLVPKLRSVQTAPSSFGMTMTLKSADELLQQSLFLSEAILELHGTRMFTKQLSMEQIEISMSFAEANNP